MISMILGIWHPESSMTFFEPVYDPSHASHATLLMLDDGRVLYENGQAFRIKSSDRKSITNGIWYKLDDKAERINLLEGSMTTAVLHLFECMSKVPYHIDITPYKSILVIADFKIIFEYDDEVINECKRLSYKTVPFCMDLNAYKHVIVTVKDHKGATYQFDARTALE